MSETLRPTPTVLFVDDRGWDSFDQVAAALRLHGVRTVRIVLEHLSARRSVSKQAWLRRLADRLFYDERVIVGEDAGVRRLAALLASGEVADVIANEPTLKKIGLESALAHDLTSHALAFCATPSAVLLDKYEVNERLGGIGIRVPRQARASELTPAEAAADLGLPLVIKDATGAAGDQVRIANSVAAAAAAIQELGGGPRLFYQEHVAGNMVLYASVIGPDGPMMDHGFSVERAQYHLGPSAVLHLFDDPDLLSAGRRATALFGCRGFASFGFVRTGDGRLLHVDANCRIFGMICAPLRLGIDFTVPYVALVTGGNWRAGTWRADPTVDLPVLPFALIQAAAQGALGDLLGNITTLLARYAPALGGRYLLYSTISASLAAVARARSGRAQCKQTPTASLAAVPQAEPPALGLRGVRHPEET